MYAYAEKREKQPLPRRTKAAAVKAVKSEDTIQRLLFSGVNAAVAPLTHEALTNHIENCATTDVKKLIDHPLVNLNVIWDGTLAGPAETSMMFVWTGAQPRRTDLFQEANHAAVAAYNFNTPATNYHIDIEILIQTPSVNTTWRENLLHELEAHTTLANKVLSIISRKTDTHIPNKLRASMTARNVDAEHLSLAKGARGIEDVQTTTLFNTPAGSQAAVLLDMAADRWDQLDELTNNFTFTHHALVKRMESNDCLDKLKKWLNTMKYHLNQLGHLTAADIHNIDTLIQQINNSRR